MMMRTLEDLHCCECRDDGVLQSKRVKCPVKLVREWINFFFPTHFFCSNVSFKNDMSFISHVW